MKFFKSWWRLFCADFGILAINSALIALLYYCGINEFVAFFLAPLFVTLGVNLWIEFTNTL